MTPRPAGRTGTKSFLVTSATSRSPRVLLLRCGREGAQPRRTHEAVDSADTLIAPVESPVLGRYRLLERLGAGGFGVVWRAHDRLLDREVAVKVIPLPAGEDGEDRERATREALAAARLGHPAIVALYEACVEDDAFYLISELVHGETLAELLATEALCDEEILEIGVALAGALLHAHQRGVIHRDLKPQNVLVPLASAQPELESWDVRRASEAQPQRRRGGGGPEPCGQTQRSASPAKLTDFGGALLAGEEALTRTGDVLGTVAYMAPEQIEGHEVDGQADLYSLALVLYEALAGVNPVRGPTPAATARRIGRQLEPLERHRRDLPRELTRALDCALDPAPRERGTLPELREALAEALERGLRRSPRRRYARAPRATPQRPAQAGPQGPAQFQSPPPRAPLPTVEGPLPGSSSEHPHEEVEVSGWLTLPRLGWLAGTLAVCTWQLTAARSGIALIALCAVAPLVLLVRRPGPRWLAPALAPALGLAGLAGAFPALAGQAARWRSRALLGALGYWWLRLAELPLDGHAIVHLLGFALLLGTALWATAAVILPWAVRGRSATLDALAAILWATALAASGWVGIPSLDRGLPLAHAGEAGLHSGAPAQSAILGAALGVVLAVAARALRGPV
jgi:eukaryotic-like serine/threonine-protein kinase